MKCGGGMHIADIVRNKRKYYYREDCTRDICMGYDKLRHRVRWMGDIWRNLGTDRYRKRKRY